MNWLEYQLRRLSTGWDRFTAVSRPPLNLNHYLVLCRTWFPPFTLFDEFALCIRERQGH